MRSTVLQRYEFQIFADYHQLYLMDHQKKPKYPSDVTNEDCSRRLKAAPYIVAVYTARNMTVPVTVELHGSEPSLNIGDWDHVAECGLAIPSGQAVIIGCSGYLPDAPKIPVTPGTYGVRAHFAGLNSLSPDGLDGNDRYLLALWPSTRRGLRVLKEYDDTV